MLAAVVHTALNITLELELWLLWLLRPQTATAKPTIFQRPLIFYICLKAFFCLVVFPSFWFKLLTFDLFCDSWDHKLLPPSQPSFNALEFLFVCMPFLFPIFLVQTFVCWHFLLLLRPQTATAQPAIFQRPLFSNVICISSFFTFFLVGFTPFFAFPFIGCGDHKNL